MLAGRWREAIGDAIGLGATAVMVWNIAKWPVLLAVVALIVALLYYATPNVKQPKFRWISVGAVVAIVTWVVASAAFGFYVANFASYDATYGSLAGVIVFLLWLWITNLALLFGAELDAELERGRELQAGMAAEETIQLPPRHPQERQGRREGARGHRTCPPTPGHPQGRSRTPVRTRPPTTTECVDLPAASSGTAASGQMCDCTPARSWRAITIRWTWLVPS